MENSDIVMSEVELQDVISINNFLKTNDLSILHLNIRSLNANFEQLELFPYDLSNKPDIIV